MIDEDEGKGKGEGEGGDGHGSTTRIDIIPGNDGGMSRRVNQARGGRTQIARGEA